MTAPGRAPLAILAACALAAACAVNPATGKRQLVLVSESQEIAMGRENDRAISAQMGIYDDPSLQDYVSALGRRLAAKSERPELEWTFRVVDDPVVNAFALPGGYIYVSRGILAHLQSEAELATVVGHEIGHVTARHSVSQLSKAQLAQLGLGLGSVLAPEEAARFGGLAQTGLGLLFLKYGRDDERQADELGLRYMMRAGYDPRSAVGVFDTLARVSDAAGGQRLPAWSSTHPAPENRMQSMQAAITAQGPSSGQRLIRAEEYRARLEGLVFGDDPRQGYFEGNLFLHPELALRIEFPAGWKTQNRRTDVVGRNAEQDAAVQLSLADASSAAEALRDFLATEGVTRKDEPMGSIHGMTTAGDSFTVQVSEGLIEGRVGFVEYGGRVYRLVGFAAQASWAAQEKTIRRCLASFDRVTDRGVLEVEPRRLHLVRLDRPTDLASFAERHGSSVPLETLALINRLDTGERLVAGRSYKVVSGGPGS